MNCLDAIIGAPLSTLDLDIETVHKKMATMGQANISKIICDITRQVEKNIVRNFETCTQNFDMKFDKIEYVGDFTKNINIKISFCDSSFILDAPSIDDMVNFINDNRHLNKIFVSLTYEHYSIESGHQSCLMIDNINQNIYIIDSNGTYMFTDNLLHTKTGYYIETLISKYLNGLKSYDLNYNFIYTNEWNYEDIDLNNKVGKNVGVDGHCVIMTLYYIKMISTLDDDPYQVLEMLDNININHLSNSVMNYSFYLYEKYLK